MGTRKDLWKTFHVSQSLEASGWMKCSDLWKADHQELIHFMACRFEEELMGYNLNLDTAMLNLCRSSWEWYLTNLFLYSECVFSYVSTATYEMARLCDQFHLHPAEVFHNDWHCMSNKGILLEQLRPENYYSHAVYTSHLWVENLAARRIFFVRQIQAMMNAVGLVHAECRVLDVGSGMGGSLRLFHGVRELVGIDIAGPMVRWCNETRNEHEIYEVMNCRAIEYPENRFEVVLCFDVLEHIDEPREALMEIKRVAQRHGVVAIVYPFGAHNWDSHISLVEKPVLDSWLESIGYVVLAEVIPPGEVYPCSVCYLLRPA